MSNFLIELDVIVDDSLKKDEWNLVFSNFQDLSQGIATKNKWGGGSNMASTFPVIRKDKYDKLVDLLRQCKEHIRAHEDEPLWNKVYDTLKDIDE